MVILLTQHAQQSCITCCFREIIILTRNRKLCLNTKSSKYLSTVIMYEQTQNSAFSHPHIILFLSFSPPLYQSNLRTNAGPRTAAFASRASIVYSTSAPTMHTACSGQLGSYIHMYTGFHPELGGSLAYPLGLTRALLGTLRLHMHFDLSPWDCLVYSMA